MDNELDLFGDGNNFSIDVPDIGEEIKFDEPMPQASDFEGVISGDYVKTVMIEEQRGINIPSYLIDISGIGEMTELAFTSLGAFLNKDGDTTIYLKTDTSLLKLGINYEQNLYRIVGLAVNEIFEGRAAVYKNTGTGFNRLVESDVSSVRLGL